MSAHIDLDAALRSRFDVCVVGAGPVGLATAVGLCRRGLSVLLIEAGLERPDAAHGRDANAEIADPGRHAPMELAVARALGGTGWLWGGRCVPIDPIDLTPRAHVDPAGWPIAYEDMARHHAEAAELIGCASARFEQPLPANVGFGDDELRLDQVERWCDEPNVGTRLRRRGLPPRLKVLLDATIVDLELEGSGRAIAALHAVVGGQRARLACANRIVLACGGLETARLLLHVQERHPALLGGVGGPLGRGYMGHMSGKVARIRLARPETAELFGYAMAGGGIARRRLALTARALEAHRLPNVIFYPDNPLLGDPDHRSGLLSALFLALSVPVIGRRLISEAIRQSQVTGAPRYAEHLRNVVLDAPVTVMRLADIGWQMLALGRRKPYVFLRSRSGEYPLHYHGEHAPSAESRVVLGEGRDRNGLRRLRIDLRFRTEDAEGIARAHLVLAAALRRSGLGELKLDVPPDRLADAVLGCSRDGYHQIGLARMGRTSADAVVDPNCRAFGIDNLYLAGSAVFRTGGQANPTFSAVTLGLRLAEHLAATAAASDSSPVAA